MNPDVSMQLLAWLARGIGAFYVVAGLITLNAWRTGAFVDRAYARLTSQRQTGPEILRGWTVLAVGALTFLSGGLLLALNAAAPVVFLACAALQGAYFAWAAKALPARDDESRRGRGGAQNAFGLYVGSTLFVLGCQSAGLLR
ncbi:MAG: hypothetical protein ACK4RV_04150 [Caulobacter sp.]